MLVCTVFRYQGIQCTRCDNSRNVDITQRCRRPEQSAMTGMATVTMQQVQS